MPRSTPTKKMAGNKTKKSPNEMNQLQQCIQQDQEKLYKAYTRSLASLDKDVNRVNQLLAKTKKPGGKVKANTPALAVTKLVESLQKQLGALKTDRAQLVTDQKAFLAEQKMLTHFRKEQEKKILAANQAKKHQKTKKMKKPVTIKPKPSTAVANQDEGPVKA